MQSSLDANSESSVNPKTKPAHSAKGFAMGILDSLENSPALKGALGQLEAAVLPVVLSEVLGSGKQGGLNAIVAKLQQAGFGDQVKSWIGNGQNLPITAEQLQQVLGSDTVTTSRPFQYPCRSAREGAGAATACGRGSSQPGGQATPHGLAGRGERFRRLGPDLPGTAANDDITLKKLRNQRIWYARM